MSKDDDAVKTRISRRTFLGVNLATTAAMLGGRSLAAVGRNEHSEALDGQGAITLSESAGSPYSILIASEASTTESFAAQELQDYLFRITGARLPLIARPDAELATPYISVGNASAAGGLEVPSRFEGDDSFRLLTRHGNVYLKGATDRATLYCVYAFLERLGCWWFAPKTPLLGAHAEHVPSISKLVVAAMDVTERPLMKYRIQDADAALTMSTAADWLALIDWTAKSRANTIAMFIDKYEENRAIIARESKRRGLILEVGKHPVAHHFLPPAQYFDAHPEWYGMIDGERTTRMGRRTVMFETAHPQAMSTFTANLIAYQRDRPEIDVLQLWPPDGRIWSRSPEGEALGSPSERMALFFASVTRSLREAGLKTRVEFLAYQDYTHPPASMDSFGDHALVDFCPIERNFGAAWEELSGAVNEEYKDHLAQWAERFPGEVRHYSYYAKYSWCSLPVALPAQIARDVRHWHSIGEVGASIYCELGNWLALEVNHLAFSRALWSADFAPGRWYDSYLDARFGAAAGAMKKFNELATRISLGALIAQSASGQVSEYEPLLADAKRAMAQAVQAASGTAAQWIVGKLAWQADYLELAVRLRRAIVEQSDESRVRSLRAALVALTSRHIDDGTYITFPFWLMNAAQRATSRESATARERPS